MTLLNLTKFKKEPTQEAVKIPDELPPLPDAKPIESGSQPSPVQQAPQAQAAPNLQPGLAPDELPPLQNAVPAAPVTQAASIQQAAPVEPVAQPILQASTFQPQQTPVASQTLSNHNTDARLYFASLIAKFHDTKQQSIAEKEIVESTPVDVLNRLNSQWEIQKKEERLTEVERLVLEKMLPLQNLEQSWRSLKAEVDQKRLEVDKKNQMIVDIEETIKKNTEELKNLLNEKTRLISELNTQR